MIQGRGTKDRQGFEQNKYRHTSLNNTDIKQQKTIRS